MSLVKVVLIAVPVISLLLVAIIGWFVWDDLYGDVNLEQEEDEQ
jgi:hypothetical protein